MKARKNNKKQKRVNPWEFIQAEFPKSRDGIIYVRQSSVAQQQNNIHSFEMQTDKFLEHFRDMGCSGHIELITDDEAMSGTLDIHVRPGMSRMMKMVEMEAVGWIAAVHVNRFTRDPWLITPAVLMKTCHEHDVWIATLRMHFNFKDPYCQRVFMLEAEESARHLEWMKLVLGGGRATASNNGYYDGRYLVPGYIVDRADPKRKKYIVYEPHARIVRWLYRRYLELDGNFWELCREVDRMPYLLPPFEGWVDQKSINKFRLQPITEGAYTGYYKIGYKGLLTILTNPVYLGWWVSIEGVALENNHEPIVEEPLFIYAHTRLSSYDLQGERQKPALIVRNSKVAALLKKVLRDEQGHNMYTVSAKGGMYRSGTIVGLKREYNFTVAVAPIDEAFLEKLFERLHDFPTCEDWKDHIEQRQIARKERNGLIRKALRETELKLQRIAQLLTDVNNPLSPSLVRELNNQAGGLETKRTELEQELHGSTEEEDDEILYEISTLIPRIADVWPRLPFLKRLRFVSALVRRVVMSHPAPGWIRMDIEWKLWGVDTGHLYRRSNLSMWDEQEDELVRRLYPAADAFDIVTQLPDRTWRAIGSRALELGVTRPSSEGAKRNTIVANDPLYATRSYQDIEYAKECQLDLENRKMQWFSARAKNEPCCTAIATSVNSGEASHTICDKNGQCCRR